MVHYHVPTNSTPIEMLLFLALSLGWRIPPTLADNPTNTSCAGCKIEGAAFGILWADLYHFVNETVYVDVETTDNSTTIISRVPNPDGASSFSSICTSGISSITKALQNPGYADIRDCHSKGVWTTSGTSYGVTFSWEMLVSIYFFFVRLLSRNRAYPTSYLIMNDFRV